MIPIPADGSSISGGMLIDHARRFTMGSLTEIMMAAIAGLGSMVEGDGLLAVFLGSVEAFFP